MVVRKPPGSTYSDEELCKLFEYYPTFIKGTNSIVNNNSFIENLLKEVKGLINLPNGKCNPKVPEKVFLAVDPSILWFDAKNMSEYIGITSLCTIINIYLKLPNENCMNACVINFYPKGLTDTYPHTDD